jgi:hypothetical protein
VKPLEVYHNVKQNMGIVVLLLVALVIIILLSPLLILFSIKDYFEASAFNKKYMVFLQSIEGIEFFCYNNKANNDSYIKRNILPILSTDIKVIFLDGRVPKSDYETKFISHMLYQIKDRKGFPYLIKVSQGRLIDKSINNDFYNTKNQDKDINLLSEKISLFFSHSEA